MDTDLLREMGLHYLAGHYDCGSASPAFKSAAGLYEMFVSAPLLVENDCALAPTGALTTDPMRPLFNGLVSMPVDPGGDMGRAIEPFRAYWQDYDVCTVAYSTLDDEGRRLHAINAREPFQYLFSTWQGHATLDYATILRSGLPWYAARIGCSLQEAEQRGAEDRAEFYHAVDTVLAGIQVLIRRYAEECVQRAEATSGAAHTRLVRLAKAFQQYLVGPPRDFFEALQLLHFMNAVDGFDNVGRLDQHLYPFYARDILAGSLDPEAAVELLAQAFDIWGKQMHWQIVVGGTTPDGVDASNELTYQILAARAKVKRPHPSLSVRLAKSSPPRLLSKALDLTSEGLGQPAFYNNELYVKALQHIGIPSEAANEFVLGGCSETHIAGRSAARDSYFNLTKALEAVFYNGRVSYDGPLFGVQTGPAQDLLTFDAFLDAYRRQTEYLVDTFVQYRNHVQQVVARVQPSLTRSIFVSGCLEAGVENCAGGADYNYGMIDVYGMPNVANCLYAVRELVYVTRRVTMAGLVEALASNFRGHENLLEACRHLPKYGNDDEQVDMIAAEVADHVFEYVLHKRLWNGDGYYAFCASAGGMHVTLGRTTGATPDGRLAGSPLANSMGPMQGTDSKGPTAMLTSVAKLPLWKCVGSPVVNLGIGPQLFGQAQRSRVEELVQTFFGLGGMQLQINVIGRETLLDAMAHPETHANLMVRVSGYSARFTELPSELQQEIVSRTFY